MSPPPFLFCFLLPSVVVHALLTGDSFPNTSFWMTEYNLDNQNLAATQDFYNQSSAYLDGLDSIERYSLFGAFRSAQSNVGPNAAMLSDAGRLTDMGAWYLGRPAMGVDPTSAAVGASARMLGWPTAYAVGLVVVVMQPWA